MPEPKPETATGQARKTFLFHIGTPKTGTTSIQNALLRLSDDLALRGVHVPYDRSVYVPGFDKAKVAKGGAQSDGLCYFFDVRKRGPELSVDWAQEVSDFLAGEEAHTLVLSHESMSQQVSKLRVDLLVSLAAQADIRFLVYLRAPLSYLSSYCQQSIEGVGPPFPRRQDMGPVTRYLRAGYAGLLAPFGKYGQVDVRNFDRLRRDGRLVPDFFRALGVDDLDPQIDALKNLNSSGSRLNQTCVLMALKRNGTPPREEWFAMRRIINLAGKHLETPMTTSFLPASLGAKISARWEEDREVLLRRYGVSFDAVTGFKPGPEVLSFSADYAAALQEAVASELSPDQQEWLTGALAFADLDLEEVLPSATKKPRPPKGQNKHRQTKPK